jgi:hypothetical protein
VILILASTFTLSLAFTVGYVWGFREGRIDEAAVMGQAFAEGYEDELLMPPFIGGPTTDWPKTWTCHACGQERPDHLIQVYSNSAPMMDGRTELTVNVRYCADSPSCQHAAPGIAARWLAAAAA